MLRKTLYRQTNCRIEFHSENRVLYFTYYHDATPLICRKQDVHTLDRRFLLHDWRELAPATALNKIRITDFIHRAKTPFIEII